MLESPLGGEMESLRRADLRAALEFLDRVGAAGDLDAFAGAIVTGLRDAIPADIVAYNEVNPSLHRAFFVSELDVEASLPGATGILERHMHDNPIVVHAERTGDGSARKWSDFVTQRRMHATPLWNDLFRPFGVQHQMVVTLPAPAPLLVGVVLHRCAGDFTERDRALFNLLRPHLVNGYRNAQARTVLTALECAGEERGEAVVVVGTLGEPLAFTPRARELVAAFGDAEPHCLPEPLLEWSRRARAREPLPPEPLVARGEELTVEARFLAPSVIALRAGREHLDPAALCTLGLTPREREVLALVADGQTNKEIAARVEVRPATVKKHLERIYDKLGVRTRTGAAAAAHRATG
jgi:DNA-binding CsgD family transcriptional regulator